MLLTVIHPSEAKTHTTDCTLTVSVSVSGLSLLPRSRACLVTRTGQSGVLLIGLCCLSKYLLHLHHHHWLSLLPFIDIIKNISGQSFYIWPIIDLDWTWLSKTKNICVLDIEARFRWKICSTFPTPSCLIQIYQLYYSISLLLSHPSLLIHTSSILYERESVMLLVEDI